MSLVLKTNTVPGAAYWALSGGLNTKVFAFDAINDATTYPPLKTSPVVLASENYHCFLMYTTTWMTDLGNTGVFQLPVPSAEWVGQVFIFRGLSDVGDGGYQIQTAGPN